MLEILGFGLGVVIGSFLNVVILRLPAGQQLNGRSHCTKCKHVLSAAELVPLLSFLFLRGQCKHCHAKISPRYFFIELATGLLFAAAFWLNPPISVVQTLLLAKILVLVAVLMVVFVIDLENFLIFDSVLISGFVPVLVLNFILDIVLGHSVFNIHGLFISSLFSVLLACLPFFLLWFFSSGKWMGFGDVKLAAFLGAALGWPLWAVGIMLAIFLGGLSSVFLLLSGKKQLHSKVPFGTFLGVGAVAAVFFGQNLLHWYLSLLGF